MRTPIRARPGATLSLLMLLTGAQCTYGAAIYRVSGQGGQGPFDRSSSSTLSFASLLEGSFKDPNTGFSSGSANNAFAAAGPGGLRADTNSWITNDNPNGANGTINTAATAMMTLDDVVISGPAGSISTSYTERWPRFPGQFSRSR